MEERRLGVWEKYLTLWVVLCMGAGVLIGLLLPDVPAFLSRLEYASVSIPVAILIWLMIYPMMLKVDFASIVNVGKNPKGLIVTWVTNWLIKPFTMYAIASLFFFVIFKGLIPQELALGYLAGAVLLGAAPCTAMVFVWSYLTKGDANYTLVQVATNDLIILVAFTPIVALLLGLSNISVPWMTLFLSVVLFVVIPLTGGWFTRVYVTRNRGKDYYENAFIPKFRNITIIGLLLTLVIIFSFQGETIIENPLSILLIAPYILYCLRVVKGMEAASQYRCSCGHDRCQQLLRACGSGCHLPFRTHVSSSSGNHCRCACRGSGDADPCRNC